MKEKISIVGLRKSFGARTILDGLDLQIFESEILCIIGKSGTGKSVVLKHLIGILNPDEGDIFVDGLSYTGASGGERRMIESRYGILFQGAALFDSMNIFDNVAFGLRRRRVPEEEIASLVPRLLEQVGLRDVGDKKPSELSGGIQKRVGRARAIALRPEIMLYDEPGTGVDPITAGAVDRLIMKMRDTYGMTSVVVTHDMKSARRIGDRIAMLYEGRVIFTGTPEDVDRSHDPVLRQFVEGKAHGPIKVL
jgi:phospholipid/cholesterol/gamma-HCH transport system ATP-binding protein